MIRRTGPSAPEGGSSRPGRARPPRRGARQRLGLELEGGLQRFTRRAPSAPARIGGRAPARTIRWEAARRATRPLPSSKGRISTRRARRRGPRRAVSSGAVDIQPLLKIATRVATNSAGAGGGPLAASRSLGAPGALTGRRRARPGGPRRSGARGVHRVAGATGAAAATSSRRARSPASPGCRAPAPTPRLRGGAAASRPASSAASRFSFKAALGRQPQPVDLGPLGRLAYNARSRQGNLDGGRMRCAYGSAGRLAAGCRIGGAGQAQEAAPRPARHSRDRVLARQRPPRPPS